MATGSFLTIWQRLQQQAARGWRMDWPGDLVPRSWYELAHARDEARYAGRALRRAPPRRPRGDWVQAHRGAFWAYTSAPAAPAAHWQRRMGFEEVPF